ncbi:MAG TPA: acetoin utilization protein AcuB [Desulfobulbaceae bacterium]|nr:acetoin utilization protein AcuB [Desulfobulbaceae bacterium]
MYVSYYMTSSPMTVGPELGIMEAKAILDSHKFRHLPVVDGEGRLLGMVTDRDIRSAFPSTMTSSEDRDIVLHTVRLTPVGEIMSANNVVLTTTSTLDDALLLFEKKKVGALPVLDEAGRVIGILSSNDLLKAWRSLFGLGEKGSVLLSIKVDAEPHSLCRLVQVLEELNVPFTRLIRSDGTDLQPPMIYLRINTYNIRSVHKAIEMAGFTVFQPTPLSIGHK